MNLPFDKSWLKKFFITQVELESMVTPPHGKEFRVLPSLLITGILPAILLLENHCMWRKTGCGQCCTFLEDQIKWIFNHFGLIRYCPNDVFEYRLMLYSYILSLLSGLGLQLSTPWDDQENVCASFENPRWVWTLRESVTRSVTIQVSSENIFVSYRPSIKCVLHVLFVS